MTSQAACHYQVQVAADIAQIVPAGVDTILDIGCGEGFITKQLAAKYRVVGVDLSVDRLRYSEVLRSVGTITRLPFGDATFDLVMANDVLEHLTRDERSLALREMTRVARRHVIVTVPLREDLNVGATRCGTCQRFYHVNGHVESFGLYEHRHFFKSLGLHCAVQVLSGDVWQTQPRAITYLRRLLAIEYACPDEPKCPICGGTTIATPRARSEWRRLFDVAACIIGLEGKTVAWARSLRTESIGLYTKGECIAENQGSGFLDEECRPVVLSEERISSATIYFNQPEVYCVDTFLTSGQLPYYQANEITDQGIRISPGQSAWAGFFVKPSDKKAVRIEVQGIAQGDAVLTVWAYDTFKTYHSPVSASVNGVFCTELVLPAATLSCFGLLFQLDGHGTSLIVSRMRILDVPDSAIVRYDNCQGKARFLRLPGEGHSVLSLPLYGRYITELPWMRTVECIQDAPSGYSWPYGLVLPIGELLHVCRIILTRRPALRKLCGSALGDWVENVKGLVRRCLSFRRWAGLWKKSN